MSKVRSTALALAAFAALSACAAQQSRTVEPSPRPSESPAPASAPPSEPTPTAVPSAIADAVDVDVTRTDTGCTTTTDELPAGTARLTVANESESPAVFELVRLNGTFEEAAEFMGEVREALARGEDGPGELPFIAHEADRESLEVGQTGELSGDVSPGTYAVVCVVIDEGGEIETANVAGPFTVAD